MPVSDEELQAAADAVVSVAAYRHDLQAAAVVMRESLEQARVDLEAAKTVYESTLLLWQTGGEAIPEDARQPEPNWSEVYAEASAHFDVPDEPVVVDVDAPLADLDAPKPKRRSRKKEAE